MRKGLLQIAKGFAALILLILVIYWTQDEESKRKMAEITGVTERVYDYYDYKRYTPFFEDVAFYGHMEITMNGDTTGLGFDPNYFKFILYNSYKKNFEPTPYINVDNYELVESDTDVQSIVQSAKPEQIGRMEVIIEIKQFGALLPVYYKVSYTAGTESNPYAYTSSYMNLAKRRTLKLGIEHGIARETLIWAKRFYKIMWNVEQLRWLYKSIYMK